MNGATQYSKQFIAGKWQEGSSQQTIVNRNPFTGDIIQTIVCASVDDVNQAYEAAKSVQKDWEATTPAHKQDILNRVIDGMIRRRDEIVKWLVEEGGSTLAKANIEWQATIYTLREAATFPYRVSGKILPSNVPGRENRVYRSAKGVVAVIGPWNFPLVLAMRSIAPAIATGNTVVVKPASETPVTAGLLIASLFEEAGLPAGVLNVVVGKGSEIGDPFVSHPIPSLISFTGSTEVGRHVAEIAGRYLKDVALELGGNNVLIVLDDAHIERAAEAAAVGKFLHQGQICMALNRIIVDDSIYDDFLDLFLHKVGQLGVGDPWSESTMIGPLINHEQVTRIERDVEQSVRMGAHCVLKGSVEGNVMHPTVLTEVTNDMPVAQNEIFGPVAPILRAKDESEAITIANDSMYGLSGSVFSSSLERAVHVAKQIQTGMIHVNDQSVNEEAHVAFGGEKSSGVGRFGGEWALDKFTTVKWVSVLQNYAEYPFFAKG
ncbi:aldehyde dehydrogenase family protein [Alicyclobacillus kakegawensis]|uniref:aldehyde dehydrogenase family protein n=1 Tax=Alicyclobacillus kakegawensis TaxID=392012 RepID=UPI000833490D|nr:aldehyde dehydrogenase family protein [Alicyclobacillus kakegawensis]